VQIKPSNPEDATEALKKARETGIEPMTAVLKTAVLPLNYSPPPPPTAKKKWKHKIQQIIGANLKRSIHNQRQAQRQENIKSRKVKKCGNQMRQQD
jgi:hypothetical protein